MSGKLPNDLSKESILTAVARAIRKYMSGEYKLSKAKQAQQAALQARAEAQKYMSDEPKATDGMMKVSIPRDSLLKRGKLLGFYHAGQTGGRPYKLTPVEHMLKQLELSSPEFMKQENDERLRELRLGSGYKLDEKMCKIALDEPDIHKRVKAVKTEIEMRGYSLGDKAIRALLRKYGLKSDG
jgi:hypothetical protein